MPDNPPGTRWTALALVGLLALLAQPAALVGAADQAQPRQASHADAGCGTPVAVDASATPAAVPDETVQRVLDEAPDVCPDDPVQTVVGVEDVGETTGDLVATG